jgi:hypothetical protein
MQMLSFGVIHSLAGGYVKVEQFEWSSKCIALVFAQSLLFPKMQMLSFGVNHSLAGGFVKVEQFEWSSGCISLVCCLFGSIFYSRYHSLPRPTFYSNVLRVSLQLYSWSGLTCRSCSSTVQ